MHNFLAGFLGFFLGVTSMFHGGATPAAMNHSVSTQQANISGTPASPSGILHRNGKGPWNNIPAEEMPFFGTVTGVTGSTLTVEMTGMMMRTLHLQSANVSITSLPVTSPVPRIVTIDLISSTTYTGGTQSDIAVNTKIAGIGTHNSDGSFTAINIQINPTMPPLQSGAPHRPIDDQ